MHDSFTAVTVSMASSNPPRKVKFVPLICVPSYGQEIVRADACGSPLTRIAIFPTALTKCVGYRWQGKIRGNPSCSETSPVCRKND